MTVFSAAVARMLVGYRSRSLTSTGLFAVVDALMLDVKSPETFSI